MSVMVQKAFYLGFFSNSMLLMVLTRLTTTPSCKPPMTLIGRKQVVLRLLIVQMLAPTLTNFLTYLGAW